MSDKAGIAALQLAILRDAGFAQSPSMKVLDLGCGNGSTVKEWSSLGMDAYGCDFAYKDGPDVDALVKEGHITLIAGSPYRLPYPDAHFDIVVTNQVMEHVRNYPDTLAEMRRVLKPTGCCLHFFPARGMPLEPHVFVPFATVVRARPWLALWARLGVRKRGQKHLGWREVARKNYDYLTSSTNYLTGSELQHQFETHFRDVRYLERSFLKHSPNARGRRLFRLGSAFPVLFRIYRAYWSRVILACP
jgi:ubiquinone/menaquinone biosynthesis C-methylase UbiE